MRHDAQGCDVVATRSPRTAGSRPAAEPLDDRQREDGPPRSKPGGATGGSKQAPGNAVQPPCVASEKDLDDGEADDDATLTDAEKRFIDVLAAVAVRAMLGDRNQ